MKKYIFRFLNAIYKLILVDTSKINVGKGSNVSWWRMGSPKGKVSIGQDCIVQCRIDFDRPNGYVSIGDRCYIGASHLVCHTRIDIADDVIISWGVTVVDHNSHSLNWTKRMNDVSSWSRGQKNWDDVKVSSVHIGPKVWIGFGATILKGLTINEGAIIGAGSVVTKDVPPYTIVAGNPARIIRELALHER